ncbi:MAG: hypothetical protein RL037_1350 [Bacteroidota bacterium]|jgi:hypothetical protein
MQLPAKIISWLFLPFLTPIYGLWITMYIPVEELTVESNSLYLLPDEIKRVILGVFIIFAVLAPAISYYSLFRRKLISTVEMDDKSERNAPLLIMFAYCMVMYTLFWYKDPQHLLPSYVSSLPLTGALVSLLFTFVNRWTKISLHAGGVGILVGYLVAFHSSHVLTPVQPVIVAVLLSGIILSSRYILAKHTLFQLNLGWCLASALSFVVNYFYPFIQL